MDLIELKQAVIEADLTEEELLDLNTAVIAELKEVRRRASRRAIVTLQPGDKVRVTGQLRGDALRDEVGEVVKVNRTRVVCRFPNRPGPITIPGSVLTKEA